jgi:hypothetical protein
MSFSTTESASSAVAPESLLSVLVAIHRGKKRGVLHFTEGAAVFRVWFVEGGIQNAEGFKSVFEKVVALDPPGGFSGDLIKDMGQAITLGSDPREALRAAHNGIVEALVRAGLAGSKDWGFQEGSEAPTGSMRLPGSLLQHLIQALEGVDSPDAIRARLSGKEAYFLSVQGALLVGDGFPPLAPRLFRMAAKGQSLQSALAALGGGSPQRSDSAWQCIGILTALGLLGLSEAKTAPSPLYREEERVLEDEDSTEVLSRPYTAESLSSRRRRNEERRGRPPSPPLQSPQASNSPPASPEITDDPSYFFNKAAEVGAMNPLLAIGLDPEQVTGPITPEVARSAFRKCAAEYHPDRLHHLSGPSREAAEGVFWAYTELRGRLGTQAEIDTIIKQLVQDRTGVKEITQFDRERARVMGKRASSFMRHRKWEPAQKLLRTAQGLDPENVMLRLREHFCAGILHEVPFAQAAKAIEALEPTGKAGQAERLYRAGWLWKLAGKEKRAFLRFRETLEVDPKNLDAQREVRLLQKRLVESAEKSETTIPFGRFFKKK